MKAIPTKIHINNINDVRKFNFLVLEDAIIAYENKEDVTSFEFYDKKNKKRVSDVKDTVSDQMANLKNIEANMVKVKEKLEANETFLIEYQAIVAKWQEDRQAIVNEVIDDEINEIKNQGGATLKEEGKKAKGKRVAKEKRN